MTGDLSNWKIKKEYRCVLDLAHYIIGGKWKLRILWNIEQENNRFSMLERAIPVSFIVKR